MTDDEKHSKTSGLRACNLMGHRDLRVGAHPRQSGQILIISLIFMVVVATLTGALLSFVGQSLFATRLAMAREQALQLADAGIEKAIWQLNETAGGYSGEAGTALGGGVFDVSVLNISGNTKEITAIGYVPNKAAPRATRKVKAQVTIDSTTVAFNFALQIGAGGVEMAQDARIVGTIYSNGVIDGTTGNNISGGAYSAGVTGLIRDVAVGGSAYAHAIQNATIGGSAYGYSFNFGTVGGNLKMYSISSCTVGGSAWYTTKTACTIGGAQNTPHSGEPDPVPQPFPISAEQITNWKNQAAAGGTISGNYNLGQGASASLGPKKITGNLVMEKDAVLTLTGPVWVQGNIDIEKDATVRLDPAYGGNSEVFLADGNIDLSKEVNFVRAGAGSYILALTTSGSDPAISIAKNSDALIAYAAAGTVLIKKETSLKQVTAWALDMEKDTLVSYETGLADVNFTGPGGSWAPLRGTWREIK